MVVFVFFCMCVRCEDLEGRKKVGSDWAKNFKLSMVRGGYSRTDNRIFNFFWFTFCQFLIFFHLNYQMIFIWQKSAVFRRWQNYAKGITSAGMVYEIISSVANLFVFCFEECWIDCFICYTIKLKHPIKILLLLINQWFISI